MLLDIHFLKCGRMSLYVAHWHELCVSGKDKVGLSRCYPAKGTVAKISSHFYVVGNSCRSTFWTQKPPFVRFGIGGY
jgi:hypothetical protein